MKFLHFNKQIQIKIISYVFLKVKNQYKTGKKKFNDFQSLFLFGIYSKYFLLYIFYNILNLFLLYILQIDIKNESKKRTKPELISAKQN